jgi:uncharacterized protein YbaR (Trm112 family)
MSLTINDLRWLACPACHHSLQLAPTGLRCTGCDRLYPIVDDLPILIVEAVNDH